MKGGMKSLMKGGFLNNPKALLNYLTTDKTVLLIVVILAVLNLIGYISLGSNHLVTIFILLALLLYYFANKNMTIVLGVPLVICTLMSISNNRQSFLSHSASLFGGREGLENKPLTPSTSKPATTPKKQAKPLNKHDISLPSISASNINLPTDGEPEPHTDEAFEGNSKKNKYRVDYASTIEDAYNELNHVLGSEGVKNMTNDTHKLMQKQLELTESMKSMGQLVQGMAPLLKQAQGVLTMIPSTITQAAK